ncbi:MAG TPA: hypothetical protein PLF90_02810, partial [bacterium]|nr:hypothetical protein [bacterium]
ANSAGFNDYKEFLKHILTEIEKHAIEKNWLPVIFALYDEPVSKEAKEATISYCLIWKDITKNLTKIKTTGYTSMSSSGEIDETQIKLATSVDIVSLNIHDEKALDVLREKGTGWAYYNNGNRFTYGIYLFKATKELNLHHRIAWHWNVCAGDPYYALDCREDDYAWFVTNAKKELIPSIFFLRLAEGIDDYRYLLTLSRLINEKPNHTYSKEAKRIIDETLSSIKVGQRTYPPTAYREIRYKVAEAIEKLLK